MRSLSCLAIVVAALASFACGAPPADTDSGNVFITEGLEGIDGLTRVTVDTKDPSCSVNGVKFGRCTFTRTTVTDLTGDELEICDLETDAGGTYSWQCDDSAQEATGAVQRYRERYYHCPEKG